MIRWNSKDIEKPDKITVVVNIDYSKISSVEDTRRYKYLSILLPFIASIATALITTAPFIVNKLAEYKSPVPEIPKETIGLLQYYKNSNNFLLNTSPMNISKEISKSKREIWFFGSNFYISAREQRKLLISKLQDGIDINYLVLDPESNQLPAVARAFDRNEDEFKEECLRSLNSLQELMKDYETINNQSKGKLTIRIYNTTPRARTYFFDPNSNEGVTYYVPYMNRVRSRELPGFLLKNSDKNFHNVYFEGIENLWIDGIDLPEWLEDNPQYKI